MAAEYIDKTYVEAFMPSDRFTALFNEGSGYDTAAQAKFTQLVRTASATIQAALRNSGYTAGDTTTDEVVKSATFGEWILLAYGGRHGIESEANFRTAVQWRDALVKGDLPPGLLPSAGAAVGGVTFSETNSSVTGARYKVFTREKLRGY